MTRRPAVTLMEVLIAMFIMAIGMLALLALFPVGAVSMAQALKDDRCASTAAMAENVAIAWDVRHDLNVTTSFTNLATASLPLLVYVDPHGAQQGLALVGASTIPRVSPTFALSSQLADRWFSLPDDMTFLQNGTPDTVTTGGVIDRGRRYSYAYLLRMQSLNLIQLYVVVYRGRSIGTLTTETTYVANPPLLPTLGTVGTNTLIIPAIGTSIKRGGWILDTTSPALTTPAAPGYFYRVTNLTESGATTIVELQTNLMGHVMQVAVMDNVAEVFDKGTSWQP